MNGCRSERVSSPSKGKWMSTIWARQRAPQIRLILMSPTFRLRISFWVSSSWVATQFRAQPDPTLDGHGRSGRRRKKRRGGRKTEAQKPHVEYVVDTVMEMPEGAVCSDDDKSEEEDEVC